MYFIKVIHRDTPTGDHDAYINPDKINSIIDSGLNSRQQQRYTVCLSDGYYIKVDEADLNKIKRIINFKVLD